jgi:hypothetical protein
VIVIHFFTSVLIFALNQNEGYGYLAVKHSHLNLKIILRCAIPHDDTKKEPAYLSTQTLFA